MIFYKTVSSGNDFIHVENQGELLRGNDRKSAFARIICDRKTGAGSDGVVFYRIRKHDVLFQIFNRDGAEAELSGNGMAGLSAILLDQQCFKDRVILRTRVGKREVFLLKKEGKKFVMKVEIGKPDFQNLEFFPFLKKNQIEYEFDKVSFYPVSMGNPHAVVILDRGFSPQRLSVIGKTLSSARIFPQGANIELVYQKRGKYQVFFFERGVGKTDSSSTGAAAVFSVLKRLNKIQDTLVIENVFRPLEVSGYESVQVENLSEIVYKGTYHP